MGSRKTMILIASIAVGAIAAFLLLQYVGGIEDRANGNAERVDVYVVAKPLAKGLTGDQARDEGFVVKDKIPREFFPPTAVTSLDQILGKVALYDIAPNQPLVDGMFVDQSQALVTVAQALKDGEVAVTIQVDGTRGVAGMLVPGDEVNVYVTPQVEEATEATEEGDQKVGADGEVAVVRQPARMLYQKVRILAIGTQLAPQPGQETGAEGEAGAAPAPQQNTGLITLAVPPEAAQLILSMSPQEIYLALVNRTYTAKPLPPIEDLEDPLPGELQDQLTPYGPEGRED